MIRNRSWLVFALVFGWYVALLVFTAQPVPANDAYFYDGAVIHQLLHGGYYNPCVARAFPVSGSEVFSAYPPLYQVPVMAWMSVFGVSALSAMGLHLCLFGLYMLVLLAIFRRLQVPGWCVNFTGFFLLLFTFRDRPDTFAHLLGILAVYACVRSRRLLGGTTNGGAKRWAWLMAVCIMLAFCTSFQIGGIYFLVVSISTLLACKFDKERIPFVPLILMPLVPVLLVFLATIFLPRAWAGFMENVRQTPFITGLRKPHWEEVAKIVRTVPGIFVVVILLAISWRKQRAAFSSDASRRLAIILLATLLPALGIIVASLSILAGNTVAISAYLQLTIVATYLGLSVSLQTGERRLRLQVLCLVPAILLISVRAVGISTWGVACAMDVSYPASVQIVHRELANHPAGYKVVMSSALLYASSEHNDLDLIHSDWMARAGGDSRISDSQGMLALKPQKLILTQFDYYRRYKTVLELVHNDPALADVQVIDTARTRTPDSIPSLQRVIQHISWAPVIVNLTWRDGK